MEPRLGPTRYVTHVRGLFAEELNMSRTTARSFDLVVDTASAAQHCWGCGGYVC